MKKTLLLVTLTLAAFLAAQAQNLEVKEFTMSENDLYAAVHTQNDYNLEPCGVIRLSLADPNAKFEGSIMYDYLTYDHGEWIIYMEKGAKSLTIKTENYPPVCYDFPKGLEIKGNVTYIMVVQMPQPEITVDEMIAQLQKAGYNISKDDRDVGGDDVSESDLVKEGKQYYEAKNYTEALRCYRKAADQGDPEGQVRLGNMYYDGKGVAKDYAEAVKWYRMAADQGFAWGQKNLGLSYEFGEGVKQDYAEAVKWYRKSAEQNYDKGQNNLGLMYYFGKGVKQDYEEAAKWFRKAADQGSAWGQTLTGIMYQYGTGVSQDYTEAVKWYRKAAEQGDSDGQCNLGVMYEYGHGVQQDYIEAVKWYRKAGEQGDARGQCDLGLMYDFGRGVEQDYAEAVKWYRKAAEQNDARGQYNLGVMYEFGQGVAEDYTEAIKWYRKAADQDNMNGIIRMGAMYYIGRGVEQDYAEAVNWYRRAANMGDAKGQWELGTMYEWGNGVPEDKGEALKWYCKAADQGDAKIQLDLGNKYYNTFGIYEAFGLDLPEGVPANCYGEAAKWYRKAAEQGNTDAQFKLGDLYAKGEGVTQNAQEALKWYLMAAEHGSAEEQRQIGDRYLKGDGIPQDYIEAMVWYRKAADQGDVEAQFCVGDMYANGRGVAKSEQEALKWYSKSAEQGNTNAQMTLAWKFKKGEGVVMPNAAEAFKWYRKAAEQGYHLAYCPLAEMYFKGEGTTPNLNEAARWWGKELENEDFVDPQAKGYMGFLYYTGKGVNQDYKKAFELFEKDELYYMFPPACWFLGEMYENGWGVERNEEEAQEKYDIYFNLYSLSDSDFSHIGDMYKNIKEYKTALKYYKMAIDYGDKGALYSVGEMYEKGLGTTMDLDQAKEYYHTALKNEGDGAAQIALYRLNNPSHAAVANPNGTFSVSQTKKVIFSKGNLQYQASTNTWRFAEHQWDFIGEDNKNISSSYAGWIDLFGWGTGNNPTKISANDDYNTFSDWGRNTIGGETNRWRTLTKDEWEYLLFERTTSIRFVKAKINGYGGIILLPDNWKGDYRLYNVDNIEALFEDNLMQAWDWNEYFEPYGAVFLPATGYRHGRDVGKHDDVGSGYWTSTDNVEGLAQSLSFTSDWIGIMRIAYRYWGQAVRLVKDY